MNEREIRNQIIKELNKRKIFYITNDSCTVSGLPDITIFPGRTVFLEIKTPTGKVQKLQHYYIDKINESGGEAYVVRSLEEVKNIIDNNQTDRI